MEPSEQLGEYQKVGVKRYPVSSIRETAEGKFWRSFKSQISQQQVAAVTAVDFCEQAPHHFAVTSSTRVVVYDAISREPRKTISRFSDVAYSGTFRSDGKLLLAGGESGMIQVFDLSSRLILRQLKGHKGAVHWAQFAPDKIHVASGGDDSTVRWWDVASQNTVRSFSSHSDYVRCGAPNPAASDIWCTGSYDHTVCIWDVRQPKAAMTLKHEYPVESVAFFPSGGLLAAAGGTVVKTWDLVSGGQLLHAVGNHQKTVTAIKITPVISNGPANRPLPPRLLTASLDCHIRAFDSDDFKVKHIARYPSPILSFDISPNGSTMAVGMATGLLAIRHRKVPKELTSAIASAASAPRVPGMPKRRSANRNRPLRATSYRYFVRGQSEKAAAEDFLVAQRRRAKLGPHDRLLRRFQYAEALTACLDSGRPEVVMAVVEELIARGGLGKSISNRDETTLQPLLDFMIRNIAKPRHAPLLIPVCEKLLDLYAPSLGENPTIDSQVETLRSKVHAELAVQSLLIHLQGVMSPLIHMSTLSALT